MPNIRYSGKVYGDLTGSIFEPTIIKVSSVLPSLSASDVQLDNLHGVVSDYEQLTASSGFIRNDLRVNGTASIAVLNTITQNNLKVGDKYITILSGGSDHASLDGSGILWGSGSAGPTVGPNGENANILYNSDLDVLKIFPGLSASVGYFATGSFVNITASNEKVLNSLSASTIQGNILSASSVNFISSDTWTPTFFATGYTITSSAISNYSKIGNMVIAQAIVTVSAVTGNFGAAADTVPLTLRNLPFTASSQAAFDFTLLSNVEGGNIGVFGIVGQNSTTASLYLNNNDGVLTGLFAKAFKRTNRLNTGVTPPTVADPGVSSRYAFTITYFTN